MAQRKRVGGVYGGRIANLWHLLTEARGTVGTGAQAEVLTKWAGNEAGRLLHRSRGNILEADKGRDVLLWST